MRRFTSVPKPSERGPFIHVVKALIFRRAVAVFHTVEPFQIGGGLRGRDGIVGGNGVFRQAQVKLLAPAAPSCASFCAA